MDFAPFKALTFDCYGTLIDWESGILTALQAWAHRQGLTPMDDRLLTAFGRAESECERCDPTALYSEILKRVHDYVAKEFGVPPSPTEADAFAASIAGWPSFPDTPDALRALQRRFKLVIVSNVDRASFAKTLPKLGVQFDAVVTAEEVGAYKPDERMFRRAFEVLAKMGVQRHEILHVAQSLYHDHMPAKALGLKSVWVNRRHGQEGPGATPQVQNVRPDLEVESLAELAALVGP